MYFMKLRREKSVVCSRRSRPHEISELDLTLSPNRFRSLVARNSRRDFKLLNTKIWGSQP